MWRIILDSCGQLYPKEKATNLSLIRKKITAKKRFDILIATNLSWKHRKEKSGEKKKP